MSQNYFDIYINRIGEEALLYSTVNNHKKEGK